MYFYDKSSPDKGMAISLNLLAAVLVHFNWVRCRSLLFQWTMLDLNHDKFHSAFVLLMNLTYGSPQEIVLIEIGPEWPCNSSDWPCKKKKSHCIYELQVDCFRRIPRTSPQNSQKWNLLLLPDTKPLIILEPCLTPIQSGNAICPEQKRRKRSCTEYCIICFPNRIQISVPA